MSDAIELEQRAATTPEFDLPDIPAQLRALMAEIGPKWAEIVRITGIKAE